MRINALFAALAVALTLGSAPLSAAGPASPGPVGAEQGPLRQQDWLIPSPADGVLMQAHLFRPKGTGPFRLAIINHGSDENARDRAAMGAPAFPALTAWLVGKGFAVLVPERPGHGATGGPYLESQGNCAAPDYAAAGLGTARSIAAALAYMRAQPFVRPTGAVIVGNSAGGWGALAFGSTAPPGVAAIVNFAGGRGGRNKGRADSNCAPDRLVEAAAGFGRSSHIPTLWLYAQNDSYFSPELSKRMYAAFAKAGGRAAYDLLPAVRGDGHALINTAGAEASWVTPLEAFLRRAGM